MRRRIYLVIMCFVISGLLASMQCWGDNKDEAEGIWGIPLGNVNMKIQTDKEVYRTGDPIKVIYEIKNTGKDDVTIITQGSFLDNCRLALFYSNGQPVPGLKEIPVRKKGERNNVASGPRSAGTIGSNKSVSMSFNLNEFFDMGKKDTYFLVMMRHLWSWEEGFLISNMISFNVEETNGKSSSDDKPDSTGNK